MYDGLLPQAVGRPGDAAAVVAVGGGEEGRLAEFVAQLLRGQVFIGHLGDIASELLRDVARHCERAAEHLEGVESKAVRFILDEQPAQPELRSHVVEPCERRDGILWETAVEFAGLGDILKRHHAKLPVAAFRNAVGGPFDLLHTSHPPVKIDPGMTFSCNPIIAQKERKSMPFLKKILFI